MKDYFSFFYTVSTAWEQHMLASHMFIHTFVHSYVCSFMCTYGNKIYDYVPRQLA